MLTLAQATAEERGFIVFKVFLVVLVAAGVLFAVYLLLYIAATPLLMLTGARRAHRVMTGYVLVTPLVLSNLVTIFGLFAVQLVAIHWLYGGVAGPQRVLERAFVDAGGSVPGGVQAAIIARLRASSGLQGSGYGGLMESLTRLVWICTQA